MTGLHGIGRQREEIGHEVTREAADRRVRDLAEKFGLRSEPGVFAACVGNGFDFCKIVELKRIDRQKVRRRTGYLKKTTEKRRELHKRKRVLKEKSNKDENKVYLNI